MAGTEIVYRMDFYNINGNACRVDIVQDGYAGATTEVTGGDVPCEITWLGEGDDVFSHIKASECRIQFISTTSLQYLGLFLATNKTYRVKVYRESLGIWQGWINPEFYHEPLSPPPYITTITATDGLALLKNIRYEPSDYTVFKKSTIDIIAYCLSQIELDTEMQLKVLLNMGMNTTADGVLTSRLFEYAYLDYRALRDGNEFMTCYDVLVEILKSWNCRLFQYNNYWVIERIKGKHTSHDFDIYNMDGSFVSSTSGASAVVNLTANLGIGSTVRFIHDPAQVEVQPAYKSFDIKQEYGNRQNILKASSFEGKLCDEDFVDDDTLRFWDVDKGTETAQVGKFTQDNGDKCILMKAIDYANTQVPSFTAYIKPIETGSPASHYVWTFNEGGTDEDAFMDWQYGLGVCYLKYKVFPYMSEYTYSAPKLTSYVKVFINCSGTVYQLWSVSGSGDTTPSNYEWVETTAGTPTTYNESHIKQIPAKSEWNEVDVALRMPEAELGNPQTYIGFTIWISSPNLNSATLGSDYGLLYKDIQLYMVSGTETDRSNKEGVTSRPDDPDRQQKSYEREYTETIDNENLLEPDVYEFRFGDTPPPYAADGYGLVNKYVIFDSANNAINKWGTITYPQYGLYQYILKWDLQHIYRVPQFKLKGSVFDTTITGANKGLNIGSILKDYNNRYYCATGLTDSMKASTMTGEWLQMYDASGATGEFNDDFSEDFWI